MKAIYEKPTTSVVVIATVQMIAASGVEDGFNKDEAPETGESSGNLSRRRSVWDDDEQEDQY